MMMTFFFILQLILFFIMIFHDWIPIPPLNDITTLKATDGNIRRLIGSSINGASVLIPLLLTWGYFGTTMPIASKIIIACFYLGITIGTILSWWVPYIFGSSLKHKQRFRKFKQTHHFLPARGDNVIPNTLHVILHILVWLCLLISIYLLFQ